MEILSSGFTHCQVIPRKYTVEGEAVSPPLSFKEVPRETKTIALICEDRDIPGEVKAHWILFNLPADLDHLEEGAVDKGVQGRNDFGTNGYAGLDPKDGSHRYYFVLWALDKELNLDLTAGKKQLREAMEGHILAETYLIGIYAVNNQEPR